MMHKHEKSRVKERVLVYFPALLTGGSVKQASCVIVDLSEHGFKLKTDLKSPLSDFVEIEFTPVPGLPLMKLHAQLKWQYVDLSGYLFLNVDKRSQKILTKIVQHHRLDHG